MSEASEAVAPSRRRRSDARRSVDAIFAAARGVLGERSYATMEEIATAAGLTRQTVYAHFASRDALIAALIQAAGVETVDALDAARLDTAPPIDALRSYLDIGWQVIRQYPFLLSAALARTPPGNEATHRAATDRLEQLIQRGQRAGDFNRSLPADWLSAAIIGLSQTAAEQVAAGRLTADEAYPLLLESVLRLCSTADIGS